MCELFAECEARGWRSQPAAGDVVEHAPADALSAADMDALISYSQPAAADDMLLADDVLLGSPAAARAAAPFVRRMTRFWLRADEANAVRALGDVLHERGYVWRRLHPRLVSTTSTTVTPDNPSS